jgi:lantibiotic leader peptide-processing serine protease
VAVIATGFASNHPPLADTVVFNACFVRAGDHTTGDCLPYPSVVPEVAWHGTHVAGTVAANFGGGVVGVGPELALANYNVFEEFEDGELRAAFDSVWTAMLDAADQGFDVINMSLGALLDRSEGRDVAATITATKRVVNQVRQQGTVIVAAAGNAAVGLDGPLAGVPGGVPGIVNVGATGIRPQPFFPQEGAFDVPTFYTNTGAAVSLVAPGGDCGLDDRCDPGNPPNWFEFLILSADVFPVDPDCAATESCPVGWTFAGGTSMSSPHVAGVAGLVRDEHPRLTPQQVEARLRRTAEGLDDRRTFGHGMVDALEATTGR